MEMVVAYPAGLTPTWDGAQGADVVALPAGSDRTYPIALTMTSPNGDQSVSSLSYAVRYYPSAERYWEGGTLAQGSLDQAAGGTVQVAVTKPGVYTVSGSAQDSVGMWASFFKTFHVTAPFDFALTLGGARPDAWPAWVLSSDALVFGAELLAPPAGFSGAYRWTVDGGAEPSSTTATLALSLPVGEHTVRLELTNTADPTGPSVVREARLTVHGPVAAQVAARYDTPAPVGLDPDVDPVPLGYAFALTVSALGLPEGVGVSVQWQVLRVEAGGATSSAQGLYLSRPSADALTNTLVFQAAGTYRVTAVVTDDRGVTAQVSRDLVVERLAPRIRSVAATGPTQGSPPIEMTFEADAFDPDGAVVSYAWAVTGQAPVVQTGADAHRFTRTFAAEGEFQVSVTVTDTDGLSTSSAPVTVRAAYQPPAITSLVAEPASGDAPLPVTFTATATDPDGGDLVDYLWTVGALQTSTGTSGAFAHTFTEPGSYTVTVTVTDSQGKSSSRGVAVSVIDPNATVSFTFRELRADGLGPFFVFPTAEEDPHAAELFGKLAVLGSPEVLDVDPQGVVDLQTTVAGDLGFNGFWSDGWGSPQAYLFDVKAAKNHEVGFHPLRGTEVALSVPAGYGCARVAYAGGFQELAVTGGAVTLSPGSGNLNTAEALSALALLGPEADPASCTPAFIGFVSGAGPALALGPEHQVPAVPLVLPAGLSVQRLGFAVNGVTVNLGWSGVTTLPTDGQGRLLVPVVPGGTWSLDVVDGADPSRRYTYRFTAAELTAAGAAEVDTAAVGQGTLALTNLPGRGTLSLTWSSPSTTLQWSQRDLTGNAILLDPAPTLAGAETVEVTYLDESNRRVRVRRLPAAQLGGTIDFAALVTRAAASAVRLSRDADAQTLSLAYNPAGDLCLVHLTASFDDWRNREWYAVVDAERTALTVKYPIPDLADPWNPGAVQSGTDLLVRASAEVSCLKAPAGYDHAVTTLLGRLGYGNFYLSNFLDAGLVEELGAGRAEWSGP
ncbi:MAG: PKD domain-containing protein [Deferrisomatales bacterium]